MILGSTTLLGVMWLYVYDLKAFVTETGTSQATRNISYNLKVKKSAIFLS